MTRRRFRLFAAFVLALAVGTLPLALGAQIPAATFAARLSDQDFWKLVAELSEANGSFRSDNLLSNEARSVMHYKHHRISTSGMEFWHTRQKTSRCLPHPLIRPST